MTLPLGSGPIALDRDQAASLARLLREVEQFLDECDESVEEASTPTSASAAPAKRSAPPSASTRTESRPPWTKGQ